MIIAVTLSVPAKKKAQALRNDVNIAPSIYKHAFCRTIVPTSHVNTVPLALIMEINLTISVISSSASSQDPSAHLNMANQPPHEWNANIYHEVEKASKDTIHLARRVLRNKKSSNSQLISLEDPIETVEELSELVCALLDVTEEQGVVSIA